MELKNSIQPINIPVPILNLLDFRSTHQTKLNFKTTTKTDMELKNSIQPIIVSCQRFFFLNQEYFKFEN